MGLHLAKGVRSQSEAIAVRPDFPAFHLFGIGQAVAVAVESIINRFIFFIRIEGRDDAVVILVGKRLIE